MDKKSTTFNNTGIEKCKFHYPKYPSHMKNVDTNKMIISNKLAF